MIGLILGILGYVFSGSELFGASLIGAVNWINTWYWIITILVGGIGLFVTFAATAGGSQMGSSTAGSGAGALGGFMVGGFIAVILVAKSVIVLMLSYYLMDSIDPSITEFGDLVTNQILALITMVILMVWPTGSSNTSSNTSSK